MIVERNDKYVTVNKRCLRIGDVEYPDYGIMQDLRFPEQLSHTRAGAHMMLDVAIGERIQGLRDDIVALERYKDAQLKEER